jgi:glutamate--cysteine ligase
MITSKEQIIDYFKSGIKDNKNFKIGIEHEKFLFNINDNTRIDYSKIKDMFSGLAEFGWKPVYEKENIVALNKEGKNITLEPGNQIELSGDILNHIHEACAESQDYLFELRQVTKKLGIKIVSAGFDPISKIQDIPNNPKQRYELMTKDMPLGGEHSLDMMYRTCGTQLNVDYNSEEDFIKKFKVVNSIVPISIALFANSSIVEKKKSGYLSYTDQKFGKVLLEVDCLLYFLITLILKNMQSLQLILKFYSLSMKENIFQVKKYTFKDFMEGKIDEIGNRLPTEKDLTTHLSTIFTENRLKKYIELRSMDACGWDCLCSGPAFNVGMIYGNLDETYDLVKNWDKDKIINAYMEAPQKGFNTQLMGKDLLHWSKTLLEIIKQGIRK